MKYNSFEIEKNKNNGIFFEMDEIDYKPQDIIENNEPVEYKEDDTESDVEERGK